MHLMKAYISSLDSFRLMCAWLVRLLALQCLGGLISQCMLTQARHRSTSGCKPLTEADHKCELGIVCVSRSYEDKIFTLFTPVHTCMIIGLPLASKPILALQRWPVCQNVGLRPDCYASLDQCHCSRPDGPQQQSSCLLC